MAPGKFLSLVTKRGLYTALRGALFWLSHDLVHVEDRNTEIVSKQLFQHKLVLPLRFNVNLYFFIKGNLRILLNS